MVRYFKVWSFCKKWHLKQLICCCLKLSLLYSFVFLASFAFWRREIFLIHKRADLRIKTVVICGQNLGGNWRNAEIMVDADFPEIIYEADFPQTASCGSPRAWERAKSAAGIHEYKYKYKVNNTYISGFRFVWISEKLAHIKSARYIGGPFICMSPTRI